MGAHGQAQQQQGPVLCGAGALCPGDLTAHPASPHPHRPQGQRTCCAGFQQGMSVGAQLSHWQQLSQGTLASVAPSSACASSGPCAQCPAPPGPMLLLLGISQWDIGQLSPCGGGPELNCLPAAASWVHPWGPGWVGCTCSCPLSLRARGLWSLSPGPGGGQSSRHRATEVRRLRLGPLFSPALRQGWGQGRKQV